MDRELGVIATEQSGERPKAFLYFQSGVNEDLTSTAREELVRKGIPFREIDLTKHTLDDEWPTLPVISSAVGFIGNLKDKEGIEIVVSFIR